MFREIGGRYAARGVFGRGAFATAKRPAAPSTEGKSGWPRGLLAVVAILSLTTAVPAAASDRVQITDPALPIKNFELVDQDGQPYSLGDLAGQTALVFFGFTHCQTVCPPTMQKLRQVYRSLTDYRDRFTCVFVSVDGDRDRPAVLREYLEPFQPGFIGLTGEPTRVSGIAAGFSAVFFKGRQTDVAGGYEVEHTSQVYLIDPAGRLRATFYNAEADDMVETTRSVLNEAD